MAGAIGKTFSPGDEFDHVSYIQYSNKVLISTSDLDFSYIKLHYIDEFIIIANLIKLMKSKKCELNLRKL